MALTLCFTSMDKATEAALRAAFDEANEKLHGRFSLADDSAAEFVIIDMDSMYGPMGWLRLHAAGKQIVGLTSAARTQADFRLGRPFDAAAMVDLLVQLARRAGVDLKAASVPEPAPGGEPEPAPGPDPQGAPVVASAGGMPVDPATTTDLEHSTGPEQGDHQALSGLVPGAELEPDPDIGTGVEAEPAPRGRVFADWMRPGAMAGRLRFRRADGPELWLDADTHQYHGPQQLKPLAAYFEGRVEQDDFEPVDDAAWSAGIAAAGEPRPMLRLQWLGGLLAGGGELLPDCDPQGRYRLTKWPQTEREYPHHFRIATAMMRGPATLVEIADASRTPLADVADFTNANLATGYAEFVSEPEPEPETGGRPGGFFGRLRRKP